VAVPWGAIINAGAQVGAAYAANKAQGRVLEAQANQAQDRTAQSGYATDKSLDLEALVRAYAAEQERAAGILKEHEARLAAPQSRASNAVRGDILANVQDVGVSAPPGVNVTSFSGGLRPSLLSANSRMLGQQMSKEALLSALNNDTPTPFSSMPRVDLSSITGRSAPEQTALPQASNLDKVMEQIGLWGGIASGIGTAMNQQPTTAGTIAARGFTPGVQTGTVVPTPLPMRPNMVTPPNPYATPTWSI
jgi:hypothetical protein